MYLERARCGEARDLLTPLDDGNHRADHQRGPAHRATPGTCQHSTNTTVACQPSRCSGHGSMGVVYCNCSSAPAAPHSSSPCGRTFECRKRCAPALQVVGKHQHYKFSRNMTRRTRYSLAECGLFLHMCLHPLMRLMVTANTMLVPCTMT